MTREELSNVAFIVKSYDNCPTLLTVECIEKYFLSDEGSEEFKTWIKSFKRNPDYWVEFYTKPEIFWAKENHETKNWP